MIDVLVLTRLISYDRISGKMTWLKRDVEFFSSKRSMNVWNSRYSGKLALNSNHNQGYLDGSILGRRTLAHRAAMALILGEWPKGEVDHINGDRKDNSEKNLRVVSRTQNARNCAQRVDNTSGFTGVHFNKTHKRWAASIGGKHIGWFGNAIEAHNARLSEISGYSVRHGEPDFSTIRMERLT